MYSTLTSGNCLDLLTNPYTSFRDSFHMLEDGKSHDYMKIVQGYAHTNALICTIPWIASLFPWLPKLEAVEKLYRFARERVAVRLPLG